MSNAAFPALRLRRTRAAAWSRALFAETVLTPADLIWPLFIAEGQGVEEPIATLPGVFDDRRVRSYTGTAGEERFFVLVKRSEAELACRATGRTGSRSAQPRPAHGSSSAMSMKPPWRP